MSMYKVIVIAIVIMADYDKITHRYIDTGQTGLLNGPKTFVEQGGGVSFVTAVLSSLYLSVKFQVSTISTLIQFFL